MSTVSRAILVVIICGFATTPLIAQSWDGLRGLTPGYKIRVLTDAGQEHNGSFKAVSNDAISLETRKGEVAIERPRVRRIQLRSNERRIRNAVIGAAVGVGIGVVVDQTLGKLLRNESGDSGRAITYAVPIALLGGVAALLPGYKTIYRAH